MPRIVNLERCVASMKGIYHAFSVSGDDKYEVSAVLGACTAVDRMNVQYYCCLILLAALGL